MQADIARKTGRLSSKSGRGRKVKEAEASDFAFRVREAIGSKSKTALAKTVNVSRSALYEWAEGKSRPSLQKTVALAKAAGVSVEWLATGEGAMEKGAEAALLRSPEEIANSFLVPRYDVRAAAGHGAIVESEQVVDHLAFKLDWIRRTLHPSNPKNLVLISAIGDSMEPEIKSGDLLLIDVGDAIIRDHAIYALAFNGQLVVKRLQRRRDGAVLIISDNPVYKTEEVPPHEVASLRVVGRVVWAGGIK